MKRAIRSLLVILNVLALCLYGIAAPASAGVAMGTSEVVICGEDGPETIRMTAEGTPAESPHDCGKCLACLACASGHPAKPAAVPQPAAVVARFSPDWTAEPAVARYMPRPQTRGPPDCTADVTHLPAAAAGEARVPSVLAAPDHLPVGDRDVTQDRRAKNEVAR